jgi:hypothetical protein
MDKAIVRNDVSNRRDRRRKVVVDDQVSDDRLRVLNACVVT